MPRLARIEKICAILVCQRTSWAASRSFSAACQACSAVNKRSLIFAVPPLLGFRQQAAQSVVGLNILDGAALILQLLPLLLAALKAGIFLGLPLHARRHDHLLDNAEARLGSGSFAIRSLAG